MINGNKLKARMVECGYTQRTLAKSLGMSKNTINLKLNGKRDFTAAEIVRMCDTLGITESEEKCAFFLGKSSLKWDDRTIPEQ